MTADSTIPLRGAPEATTAPRHSGRSPAAQVCITGAGLATALGLGARATWAAVSAGRCGVGPSTAMESEPRPDKGSGQAPDLPAEYLPGRPREVRYLRWAIEEAWRGAGLETAGSRPYPIERCGLTIGTTLHGMRAGGAFLRSRDTKPLSDFLAAATLRRAAAGLPVAGFTATPCAACASGLSGIAMGMTLLRSGQFDLVIAGGYDPISEYAYGGFNSLRLIAEGPQRPFAREREGMKLAEGYGVVVLERERDARRRGAGVLARLLACEASSDAHHLSQPHPEGEGAGRAIESALNRAGLGAERIDMIAAHATATPDNDAAEHAALRRVFGERLPRIPVAAFKSHLGHSLGAAGAVELILAATAAREGVIPPCANVRRPDVEFHDLNLITGEPRFAPIHHALVTSLGFGGSNACAILAPGGLQPRQEPSSPAAPTQKESSPPQSIPQAPPVRLERGGRYAPPIRDKAIAPRSSTASDATAPHPQDVLITGLGAIVPGATGNEAFKALFRGEGGPSATNDTGPLDEKQLAPLITARRIRRLSAYVKGALAATSLACADAGIASTANDPDRGAAVSATTHGSAAFSVDYYRQIVEEGIEAAHPLLFAEGVPNAGSAHLSMMLGLKGPCQTLIGSRTAGLDALILAAMRIRSGEWDRAIVGGAEEFSPLVNRAYGDRGLYAGEASIGGPLLKGGSGSGSESGFVAGAGAVSLVLESRSSAERRGARGRGLVGGGGQAVWSGQSAREAHRRIARLVRRIGRSNHVLSSANGTILDRVESLALRRAIRDDQQAAGMTVSSIHGLIAECFSAGPLAAIAAVLLTGRMPRFQQGAAASGTGKTGPSTPSERPAAGALRAATGREHPESFAVLASDYNGLTSAVEIHTERDNLRETRKVRPAE